MQRFRKNQLIKDSKATASSKLQRIFAEVEKAILDWILRLQAWEWSPRIEQVRLMAEELLRLKGDDDDPIGINWPSKFLKRHPSVKSIYVPPLDKERTMAEDPKIIDYWFGLFSQVKK